MIIYDQTVNICSGFNCSVIDIVIVKLKHVDIVFALAITSPIDFISGGLCYWNCPKSANVAKNLWDVVNQLKLRLMWTDQENNLSKRKMVGKEERREAEDEGNNERLDEEKRLVEKI